MYRKFFICFVVAFALLMTNGSFAFTIGIGGNIEDTAVKTDHITTDVCIYIYNCDQIRHISVEGKSGLVKSGSFSNKNLKSKYAATATNSKYAETTEKASWADYNQDEETQLTAAFTSKWVNDPTVENADHASKALGAEYAPSATESLAVSEFADVVVNMHVTDFYASSLSAGTATVTNIGIVYTGSDPLYISEKAIKWKRPANQYIEY